MKLPEQLEVARLVVSTEHSSSLAVEQASQPDDQPSLLAFLSEYPSVVTELLVVGVQCLPLIKPVSGITVDAAGKKRAV